MDSSIQSKKIREIGWNEVATDGNYQENDLESRWDGSILISM